MRATTKLVVSSLTNGALRSPNNFFERSVLYYDRKEVDANVKIRLLAKTPETFQCKTHGNVSIGVDGSKTGVFPNIDCVTRCR